MGIEPRIDPDVRILDDPESLARAAAGEFVRLAREATAARGAFFVALSGGSTPRRAYELVAEPEFRERVDWERVVLFLVDERHVPPTHPDSNYRMVDAALASRVPLPPGGIERYATEDSDPAAVASRAETRLRERFRLGPDDAPRFDLVMLGLGADGHTASIFPGTTAVAERRRLVAPVRVEELGAWRLTLTLPVINRARSIVFLVSGAGKAAILSRVLLGGPESPELPARLVRPSDGSLVWLVDRDAASKL